MGAQIDREEFSPEDYARFGARLQTDLATLRALLARPGFGEGPTTIGSEVELHLVDAAGRPAPKNEAVLAAAGNPHLTVEIDRFNLEINAPPCPLAGLPFSTMARTIEAELATVQTAAAAHGASPSLIGSLPTLEQSDLGPAALTDLSRYRVMAQALQRLRGNAFPLQIRGADSLELTSPDVTFEGANASFQVHLRVPPAAFASTYNAMQVAAGPVLAISCNSPYLLERRLWDETRVALFRQVVDDRRDALDDDWRAARVSFGHGWVRASAGELFAQTVAMHEPLLPLLSAEDPPDCVANGDVPALAALRLHNGTVWQWNRAIYDPSAGGHLRIEFRALPSGPTVVDMVANAAFFLGLTLALTPAIDRFLGGFVFGHARRNFYESARHGLGAELLWPPEPGRQPVLRPAPELIAELVDTSRRGLESAGVAASEAAHWLGIISARAGERMPGARWQDLALRAQPPDLPRRDALAAMFARYRQHADAGRPVHEWSRP